MPSHGYVLEYLGWGLKSPTDNSRTEDVLAQNIQREKKNLSTAPEKLRRVMNYVSVTRRVCASRKKPLPTFFNTLRKNIT